VFWTLFRPDGQYARAAVFHDYLYWDQKKQSKDKSDRIFKINMEELAVDRATVFILYNVVSLFGQRAWNTNAQLKQRGEKRILAKFPEEPEVTWDIWKTRPDVFATEVP
jgi:hypothetical protein